MKTQTAQCLGFDNQTMEDTFCDWVQSQSWPGPPGTPVGDYQCPIDPEELLTYFAEYEERMQYSLCEMLDLPHYSTYREGARKAAETWLQD